MILKLGDPVTRLEICYYHPKPDHPEYKTGLFVEEEHYTVGSITEHGTAWLHDSAGCLAEYFDEDQLGVPRNSANMYDNGRMYPGFDVYVFVAGAKVTEILKRRLMRFGRAQLNEDIVAIDRLREDKLTVKSALTDYVQGKMVSQ